MFKPLRYTISYYISNIKIVTLLSLPILIAVILSLLLYRYALPQSYALFISIDLIESKSIANIIVAVLDLIIPNIFISFSIAMLNLLLKSRRTFTKITNDIILSIERYTSRIFVIVIAYMILSSFIFYLASISSIHIFILTAALISFIIYALIFYAPNAIVLDDLSIINSIKKSIYLQRKRPAYFICWIVLSAIVVLLLILISLYLNHLNPSYTTLYNYLIFTIYGLFFLPFIILLQANMYLDRYKLLK
ncbi:MAG: hypothetical protein ARM1_0011 [Candidatus Micrarchaeota archaeon]|nr:MAG: hypothetical protein ARM1_0011 [Candidatus Micrarchaeota archaeon]